MGIIKLGVYMDYKKLSLASALALGCVAANAQEIAKWSGFREGAASFTFDDGAPSQVSDAAPMFDKYGYKGTFNLVVSWNPDWSGFQNMANNGHEIASHSITHGQNMSGEEASSKKDIESHITQDYGCITVAYPNCNVPNASAVRENYIAGRICNGSWQSVPDIMDANGPTDWTKVPALMTGSENGSINSKDGYTGKMQDAIAKGGWVMFLTHGFQGKNNGKATYSPTDINAMDGALQWAKENDAKIWVTSFRSAAMYVKERNAAKIEKADGSADALTFKLTHNIADNVSKYDYPLSIRVKNESNWSKVTATQDGADIEAEIKDGYIYFEGVPNKGDIVLKNGNASSQAPASSSSEAPASSSESAPESSSSSDIAPASSSSAIAPASSSSDMFVASVREKPTFEATSFAAYVDQNGVIVVKGAQDKKITVFNSLGHAVRTTRGLGCEQRVYSGAKGMYIVRIENKSWKLNIK